MEKAKEWLEYQMVRLNNIGLDCAGEILKTQKDFVIGKTQNLEWNEETIPFLAVIPHQYLKKIEWTCIGGRVMQGIQQIAYVICRKNDLRGCGEIYLTDQEVSEGIQLSDPYWIFNVQTGSRNIGVPQDKVLMSLTEKGRRLLTLSEATFLTFFAAHTPFEGAQGIEVPFDLGTNAMMSKWVGVKPISRGEISSFGSIQPSARLGIFRSEGMHPRLANYFSNEGGAYRGTPSCTC